MAQATAPANPAAPTQVYTIAVLLALFCLLVVLLILPPLFWHFRNRNIGATSLVAWIVVLLLFTSINAMIWPSDDILTWIDGRGLCDVEIKIQVASQVALPASFAAVLRGLAAVLDTDHATLMQTKVQRRRNLVLDLLFCVGAPLLQMIFHEIVHFSRYVIHGIAGCTPVVNESWLTLILIMLPPLIWTLVDAAYAILILIRLYRYRLTFASILATNQTTKSRFMRLYIICVLWIIGFLPVMCWILAYESGMVGKPFSWSETHDHTAYTQIFMVPSNGVVHWDRWIWLPTGICIFLFFGCGREAVGMYRNALLAMGLGRMFPRLRSNPTRRPTVSTISSISSKAKMLFKRKSSASDATWSSTSSTSHSRSHADDPVSPKHTTFLEAIREVTPERDVEKAHPAQPKPSIPSRLISFFSSASFSPRKRSSAPVSLAELSNQNATVRSTVSAGQRPTSLIKHVRDTSSDVLVRKEVRQGSEHESV